MEEQSVSKKDLVRFLEDEAGKVYVIRAMHAGQHDLIKSLNARFGLGIRFTDTRMIFPE